MKKTNLLFLGLLITSVFSIFFSSCGGDEYKAYDAVPMDILHARGTELDYGYWIYCSGKGDMCKVGGPNDGRFIQLARSYSQAQPNICILDTLDASDEIRNSIQLAFDRNQLASLASDPQYNMVFRKRPDRDEFIEKISDGTYKAMRFSSGDIAIYNGEWIDPEFLYITVIPK